MKLNLEQKAVTVNTNKEIRNGVGEILGIPAGQFQKMGGLGGGGGNKFDFGKNKCTKRARGKKHNKRMKNKAQNFLQSTETKSKYPSLTW